MLVRTPASKRAEPAPRRPRSPVKTAVAGIAAGAIAVIAIGAGLWFGGYVPPGLLPAIAECAAAE